MRVTNLGGYFNTSYEHLSVIIADVPSKPSSGPQTDFDFTDSTRIRMTFDKPYNGGSNLLNYEV